MRRRAALTSISWRCSGSDILPGEYDLDGGHPGAWQALPAGRDRVPADGDFASCSLLDGIFESVHRGPVQRELGEIAGHAVQAAEACSSPCRFDVVHFDTIGLAGYREEVGSLPKILNHHNMESHLLRRRVEFESHPLKRFYYAREAEKLERFQQRVCPEFNVHFTVSEVDRERLLELVPGLRAEVIANGVDVDYFRPSGEAQTPGNLVMASGMNWFPNRDAVLYMCDEIWPRLCARMPALTWTVVGSSPPQRLLDLAANDSRITVTGFVDDVRPYLDRAEIYLCPMRDGGGTRLKILDALSMSKPIVSTTMGCEGIDITPGLDVLLADTPDEFVEQVARLRARRRPA